MRSAWMWAAWRRLNNGTRQPVFIEGAKCAVLSAPTNNHLLGSDNFPCNRLSTNLLRVVCVALAMWCPAANLARAQGLIDRTFPPQPSSAPAANSAPLPGTAALAVPATGGAAGGMTTVPTQAAEGEPAWTAQYLRSARSTLDTFLRAMQAGDTASASQCLDFAARRSELTPLERDQTARQLYAVLQRLDAGDWATLSDDSRSDPVGLPSGHPQPPIVLSRDANGLWRFTSATLDHLPALYRYLTGATATEASNAARPASVVVAPSATAAASGTESAATPATPAEEIQPPAAPASTPSSDSASQGLLPLASPLLPHAVRDPPFQLSGIWLHKIPVLENELWRVVAFAITLLVLTLIGRMARVVLGRAATGLEHRHRRVAAVAIQALERSVSWVALTVGLHSASGFLQLDPNLASGLRALTSSLLTVAFGYVGWCLVDIVGCWLESLSVRTDTRLDDMLVPLVNKSLRGAVVIMTLAQVATTFSEKPLTSIIAGLGIGGLAIGLAAQDAIKNLFGSLMIFSDRPFEMGDRITVDGHNGPVERVGFRSTRLRTSDGVVTIPNGTLAGMTILNVGKPRSIKRSLTLRLAPESTPEQVSHALDLLKFLLQGHEGMPRNQPPVVVFDEIAEDSLNLSATYWYSPADGEKAAAFHERLNLEILRQFRDAGLRFAGGAPPEQPPRLQPSRWPRPEDSSDDPLADRRQAA